MPHTEGMSATRPLVLVVLLLFLVPGSLLLTHNLRLVLQGEHVEGFVRKKDSTLVIEFQDPRGEKHGLAVDPTEALRRYYPGDRVTLLLHGAERPQVFSLAYLFILPALWTFLPLLLFWIWRRAGQ